MTHMEIEFDPSKAAENPAKHDGVTFHEAASALLDPYALSMEKTRTRKMSRAG